MSGVADETLAGLIGSIGAKTPAPGGGAATGVVGAVSAALARMVVSFSVGSKKLAEHRDELRDAADRVDALRERFLFLADADAEAYDHLNTLQRLPDDDGRKAQIPDAAMACVNVPLDVIDACSHGLAMFERLSSISNRQLRSDLAIAAVLLEATARASMWNVRINLPTLAEHSRDEGLLERADAMLAGCADRLQAVEAACR